MIIWHWNFPYLVFNAKGGALLIEASTKCIHFAGDHSSLRRAGGERPAPTGRWFGAPSDASTFANAPCCQADGDSSQGRMMEVLLLVLAIGLIPVYAFGSGGVQISHVLLAILMGIRLARMKWNMGSAEVVLLALFVLITLREGYAIFIDSAKAIGLLDILFTSFALLMVFTFSRLPLDRKIFRRAVLVGLLLAVSVGWLGIWWYGVSFVTDEGSSVRAVGTFNNPNQLAYFALCTFSIASLLYLRDEIKTWLYLVLTASSCALAMAALSKAGLISVLCGALIAVSASFNNKRISGKLIAFCILLTVAGAQIYAMGALDDFQFVQRLDAIGTDSDDNLTARGYRSPFQHGPVGLLVGLGEQKVHDIIGHEVHSTFWSYLMKYGLVGLGLFLTFWYLWIRRTMAEFGLLGVLLINMPASIYGITHNGSRFAIFWLMIGLSFNLYRSGATEEKQKGSPRRPAYAGPYTGLAAIDWQAGPRA
jgi:hypothetical protein